MLERIDFTGICSLVLVAAAALALAGAVRAQGEPRFDAGGAGRETAAPAPGPLDLEIDRHPAAAAGVEGFAAEDATALGFGPADRLRGTHPSGARRGLFGSGGAAGLLRLNIRGFSVLRLQAGSRPDFSVRRLRNKQRHRPLISFTVNKRF